MRSTLSTRWLRASHALLSRPALKALAARVARVKADDARRTSEHARPRAVAAASDDPRAGRDVGERGAAPRSTVGADAPASATGPAPTSRRRLLGLGAKAAVATAAAGVLAERVGTRAAYADNTGVFSSSVSGTPAVSATGTNGAHGIDASSDYSVGVYGASNAGNGVAGVSTSGNGVYANSSSEAAVYAVSNTWNGVTAISNSGDGLYAAAFVAAARGIRAVNYSNASGSIAVLGHSDDGTIHLGPGIGVQGETAGGTGVYGTATTGYGVAAHSASGTALSAGSGTGSAIVASSGGVGYGLYLTAPSGWAIGCNGRLRLLGPSVGTVTLAHGTTSKTVSSSACSGSSQVILTPTSDPQVRVWATVTPGAFTVHGSSAASADVTFSYLLIN